MKKLESIIFYLFIFSIPVQSRLILHKWGGPLAPHLSPSGVGAGFNQWASAYLYGTDILLAAIFMLWLLRSLGGIKISSFKFKILSPSFFLVLFFIISAVSIFSSRIVGLSFYQLLKLAEFIGFYFYLKKNIGEVFSFQRILTAIIISGIFQSAVAIAQYIKQGSVGLRLLGESPLSVNATGVAVFIADGVKYLRAYGTTPHPNILAAWLFAAIFAFYFWYVYRADKKESAEAVKILPLIIYAILLFGFFFTFSRVIIGLWVLGVLARLAVVFLKREFRENTAMRRKITQLSVVSAAVVLIFSAFFWPQVKSRIHISAQEEAVTQRVYYNKIAGSIAAEHPSLGVGIGQFVPNMMAKFRYLPSIAYQPVHNIYLLVASETGFLGLALFLGFAFTIFYRFAISTRFKKLYHFSFFILTGSFLLVGLFDHFLWTSQQGSLIFWMMLALVSIDLSAIYGKA